MPLITLCLTFPQLAFMTDSSLSECFFSLWFTGSFEQFLLSNSRCSPIFCSAPSCGLLAICISWFLFCNLASISYHCLIISSVSLCPLNVDIPQGSVFHPLFFSPHMLVSHSHLCLTTICTLMASGSTPSAQVFSLKLHPCLSSLLLKSPPEWSPWTLDSNPKQNYFLPTWASSSSGIYSLFQLMVLPFT